MKVSFRKWRLFALMGALVLLLTGCSGESYLSTLQPQGENAKILYDLMILSTIIMAFVVIVVTVIFIIATTRFRRTKDKENFIPVQVEGSHKLEILWTVIPIILLIILAVPTVKATFELDVAGRDEIPEDAVEVDVMARLYWWEFAYPDEKMVTSQDLVIPAGERVYLNLTAADVKHAFWIPAIAGKIDTNIDGENHMWIQAEKPGLYYGKCTELCGPSHALMDFKVRVLSKDDYKKWVASMKEPTASPAGGLAAEGEAIFKKSCIGCHAVDSNDTRPAKARIAPNLSNFADRDRVAGILDMSPENVAQWLKDPESLKQGNLMTGTYPELNDNEVKALTEYLMGLSKEK